MLQTKYQGTVGYIGLGNMGGGIAAHLAQVGVNLVVCDLNQAAIQAVVAEGARGTTSLQELVEASDVIVVCVDPEPQVPKVVDQVIPHLRPGQTVIIQSSVPPQWVGQMAERVSTKGASLFDAPVSGSHDDRRNGTLAVPAGASREEVGPINDLLESIGRPLYLKALGGGQTAKLANNALMSVTRLAAAESLEFGRAFGLSEEMLIEAIKISSGSCFVIDNWGYFEQQLSIGFTHQMSLKQTVEILDIAEKIGVPMRMTKAVRENTTAIDDDRLAWIGHDANK